jgi:hypothetical protein
MHFSPPHITGAKNFHEYATALKLWWAFRALREAGQSE